MKSIYVSILIVSISFVSISCSSSKTYLTPQVRERIENNGVNLNKLQFYIDRNIELKREVTKEEAKITKGNIKIENGKYINIIKLKKNTPGICSSTLTDKVQVSFENGENKSLTFGRTKSGGLYDPYKILAFEWFKNGDGMIRYEGKSYRIDQGTDASVMIKSKFIRKSDEVKERKMEGVKIAAN